MRYGSSCEGDKSLLMETEKFFSEVLDIPRLANRRRGAIHIADEQMQLVTKKQQAMKAACKLEKSKLLRKVLSSFLPWETI